MRRTYKYRLYPIKEQMKSLNYQLSEARSLYNAALQERRDAWKMQGVSLNYFDQANQLKEIRDAGNLGLANFSACQDVLRRVDKTYRAFYRRIRNGEKAGYPRFKGRDKYNSFVFPAWGDGCHITEWGRLKLQGIGIIKLKLHRPIVGEIKTLTIKREADKWYACFSLMVDAPNATPSGDAVGIDVGLCSFAALSDGQTIENPRNLKKSLAKLRRCQRRVSKRKLRSHNRRKAVRLLQKTHIRIRNQRADFQHKLSRQIANSYGFVAIEDLHIENMVKNHHLAQSIEDAGWGSFLAKLAYKVEETGGHLVRVNPNGTSQRCSRCSMIVPKSLAVRIHRCPYCGLEIDRDVNSARDILRLGLSLWDKTWGSSPCVSQEAVCFS